MTDLEGHDLLPRSELTFSREDNWIVVSHAPSGVTTQGRDMEHAHEMITEAVLLHRGEIGEELTTWEEERAALADLGFTEQEIQEIEAARDDPAPLPDFLK